ncbi:MAG: hypothetical protein ACLPZR_15250 [Solirubrobacteraceae bacterium]
MLTQFLVVETSGDRPRGIVAVYRPNFEDRHAYLAAASFDARGPNPNVVLGLGLFVDYVFTCWDFRKLYMELPEFNLEPFATGVGWLFELEATMREHLFYSGRYWDRLVLALYRDTWRRERSRFLLPLGERNDAQLDESAIS